MILRSNLNGNDDVLASDEAKTIAYDDETTQLNASTVQIAIEKLKEMIESVLRKFAEYLPLSGGVVDDLKVNGTLDATATGNALPIVVETAEITGSVNGTATATLSGSVALDGFAPLGVVGYEVAGSSQCYVYRQYITGTQARFYVRNNGSGTVNLTITAHVLYQVSDTVPVDEPAPLNEGE